MQGMAPSHTFSMVGSNMGSPHAVRMASSMVLDPAVLGAATRQHSSWVLVPTGWGMGGPAYTRGIMPHALSTPVMGMGGRPMPFAIKTPAQAPQPVARPLPSPRDLTEEASAKPIVIRVRLTGLRGHGVRIPKLTCELDIAPAVLKSRFAAPIPPPSWAEHPSKVLLVQLGGVIRSGGGVTTPDDTYGATPAWLKDGLIESLRSQRCTLAGYFLTEPFRAMGAQRRAVCGSCGRQRWKQQSPVMLYCSVCHDLFHRECCSQAGHNVEYGDAFYRFACTKCSRGMGSAVSAVFARTQVPSSLRMVDVARWAVTAVLVKKGHLLSSRACISDAFVEAAEIVEWLRSNREVLEPGLGMSVAELSTGVLEAVRDKDSVHFLPDTRQADVFSIIAPSLWLPDTSSLMDQQLPPSPLVQAVATNLHLPNVFQVTFEEGRVLTCGLHPTSLCSSALFAMTAPSASPTINEEATSAASANFPGVQTLVMHAFMGDTESDMFSSAIFEAGGFGLNHSLQPRLTKWTAQAVEATKELARMLNDAPVDTSAEDIAAAFQSSLPHGQTPPQEANNLAMGVQNAISEVWASLRSSRGQPHFCILPTLAQLERVAYSASQAIIERFYPLSRIVPNLLKIARKMSSKTEEEVEKQVRDVLHGTIQSTATMAHRVALGAMLYCVVPSWRLARTQALQRLRQCFEERKAAPVTKHLLELEKPPSQAFASEGRPADPRWRFSSAVAGPLFDLETDDALDSVECELAGIESSMIPVQSPSWGDPDSEDDEADSGSSVRSPRKIVTRLEALVSACSAVPLNPFVLPTGVSLVWAKVQLSKVAGMAKLSAELPTKADSPLVVCRPWYMPVWWPCFAERDTSRPKIFPLGFETLPSAPGAWLAVPTDAITSFAHPLLESIQSTSQWLSAKEQIMLHRAVGIASLLFGLHSAVVDGSTFDGPVGKSFARDIAQEAGLVSLASSLVGGSVQAASSAEWLDSLVQTGAEFHDRIKSSFDASKLEQISKSLHDVVDAECVPEIWFLGNSSAERVLTKDILFQQSGAASFSGTPVLAFSAPAKSTAARDRRSLLLDQIVHSGPLGLSSETLNEHFLLDSIPDVPTRDAQEDGFLWGISATLSELQEDVATFPVEPWMPSRRLDSPSMTMGFYTHLLSGMSDATLGTSRHGMEPPARRNGKRGRDDSDEPQAKRRPTQRTSGPTTSSSGASSRSQSRPRPSIECPNCGKAFRHMRGLTHHLQVHEDQVLAQSRLETRRAPHS
jgi:hypothetical protein